MSGHSKWHSIRHKKAANDNKRGKVLTRHAKLISVAGKSDPNPETNATLRNAIINAKADSVPNDNIQRILKKLSGQGKDAIVYNEYIYEGYCPEGVPFVITCLTENNNRTFHELRTAVTKNGGTLGVSGATMFMFEHLGIFLVQTAGKTEDEMMEVSMEAGARDMNYDEELTEIICEFTDIGSTRDSLLHQNIEITKSEPEYRAKDPQIIESKEVLDQLESFIDVVDELDDVSDIFTGFFPA